LLLDGPASRVLEHLCAPAWIQVLSSCHFKVNIYHMIRLMSDFNNICDRPIILIL
jgi:hypothetical protein